LEQIRGRLQAGRTAAIEGAPTTSGLELGRRMLEVMDRTVLEVMAAAARAVDVEPEAMLQRVQPVALGSYGRGDFCPYSDVDLMLLSSGPVEWADPVLYGLWDVGLQVGHAVRTLDEAVDLAMGDHTILSSLIEARAIVGPNDCQGLRPRIDALLREEHRAHEFIRHKLEEASSRRAKFGQTIYMLEPNVKESPGGLRELHHARWIAYARWRVASPARLLQRGVLSETEGRAMQRAEDFMVWTRWNLHAEAGRKQDHLRFDLQEKLARTYTEGTSHSGKRALARTELFMRAFYFHASTVERVTRDLIDRATAVPASRSQSGMTFRTAPGGFKVWNGELTVAHRRQFEDEPASLVRLFRVAQEEALPIYSYTKNLIREGSRLIDREFRRRSDVVSELFWLVEDPKADGSMLDLFHQLGVLRGLIPEFRRVTARWQHSLYHVYTVDVHSLVVLKNLKRLRRGDLVEKVPELTRWMGELYRPHVLYFAGLLHDVGKGWPREDHSVRGERVAYQVGRRFEEADVIEWGPRETEDLAWLVRDHLLMSDLSQRRDVSDPVMLAEFAERCQTTERLRMLHILTFADMLGTSPKVWNEWKGALLSGLYQNTVGLLEGREDVELRLARRRARLVRELASEARERPELGLSPEAVHAFAQVMPSRYVFGFTPRRMARHVEMWRDVSALGGVAVHVTHLRREGNTRLTVVCPDQPGLLATLAGLLAANRMQISSAQIFSFDRGLETPEHFEEMDPDLSYDLLATAPAHRAEGLALDVLHVTDEQGEIQDDPWVWRRFKSDLEAALFRRIDVRTLFEERRPPTSLGPRALPPIKIEVQFHNHDDRPETIIDVWGPDHLGVLFHLAEALTADGLTISLAKVSSQGGRIADGFYVTDTFTGRKITDPVRQQQIRERLIAAFEVSEGRPRALAEIV
jgi:[protein-PII] uridylyltransferase